jgi:tRNA(Arg) A34 adenosine deaminase TadA
MFEPSVHVKLPEWLVRLCSQASGRFPTVDSRVDFAVGLARENVARGTGGPFGAAVFDVETGELAAAGVNLVVSANCSVLHAEIVAIVGAQSRLGTYDLAAGGGVYELASSAAPCAMCLGAIPWSGIRRLSCGARGSDVEAIGFDEGDKPEAWEARLAARGIEVFTDVCRQSAVAVLCDYAARGGPVYNSSR